MRICNLLKSNCFRASKNSSPHLMIASISFGGSSAITLFTIFGQSPAMSFLSTTDLAMIAQDVLHCDITSFVSRRFL